MKDCIAVIEAGGTKFNCALVTSDGEFLSETRIGTTTPEQTMAEVISYFRAQREQGFAFSKMGIASFGPVDLNPASATYGYITATPKPHWSNTDLVGPLKREFGCEIAFDTDVNGAALAESLWGAATGTDVAIYVTVGTGIGGGIVINGKPVHGLIHPELGHMLLPNRHQHAGACPFHGDCLEGLASGAAMGQIWQQAAETLEDDHPAWQQQAEVLAAMCHNLLVTLSPQKIVLGGGVMAKPGLLEQVVILTTKTLAGYLTLPADMSLKDILCLPGLGNKAGMLGALALTQL